MSASPTPAGRRGLRSITARRSTERSGGDAVLRGLCILAALTAAFILGEIVYQMITGARPAISRFGLGFLGHTTWAPNLNHFGAGEMLYGTAVTSAIAMVIAIPVAVSIALYLALLAPRAVRVVVGPLVEMLAAIPSVILGFWGILFLAPFIRAHVEPLLHNTLGFLPIFGAPQTTGLSVFTAGLILTIMVVPIIASLSRDLFLTVPRELKEGAEALGGTPWEVIRGVVLPSTVSGVVAAASLGLGRALGESIAVASVIGGGNLIHVSTFETGNSAAGRIALDIQYYVSKLQLQSIFYLALILLAFGVLTNLLARMVASRYDVNRAIV
ncbi:MAG TPA: phosphate ABC transporter permease subunit PstC [Solirubrobacteraceae bacterium]|nr:phosphate ABC transporter permease subunit PstC [Solirubrobacteraceae bacterium]